MTYRSSDQWPIDSTVESLLVIRFIREIQLGARSTKDRRRTKPVIRKKKKKERQDEEYDEQLRRIGRTAMVKDGFSRARESLSNRNFLPRLILASWTSANAVFLSTKNRWLRPIFSFLYRQIQMVENRENFRTHIPRQLPNLSAGWSCTSKFTDEIGVFFRTVGRFHGFLASLFTQTGLGIAWNRNFSWNFSKFLAAARIHKLEQISVTSNLD